MKPSLFRRFRRGRRRGRTDGPVARRDGDRRGSAPARPGHAAAAVIDDFIVFDPAADIGAEVKRLTGGRGAHVVYDAVGGVTTAAALASLAHRGRLVVISAVGTRAVEIDLIDLYHNETRILGSTADSSTSSSPRGACNT